MGNDRRNRASPHARIASARRAGAAGGKAGRRKVRLTEKGAGRRARNRSAEQEVNRRLRALSAGLVEVREEERARIAREIHDELGQTLTALNLDVAWLRARVGSSEESVDEKMEEMARLIGGMMERVQQIAAELRPAILDDLGLAAAVGWLAGEFGKRTGIPCSLSIPGDLPEPDGEHATVLFRIFQETLTNITRHARAGAVTVTLRSEGHAIVLTVTDDGVGLSDAAIASRRSLGILGMKERAVLAGGEVTFRGTPGKGTVVKARIPTGR